MKKSSIATACWSLSSYYLKKKFWEKYHVINLHEIYVCGVAPAQHSMTWDLGSTFRQIN